MLHQQPAISAAYLHGHNHWFYAKMYFLHSHLLEKNKNKKYFLHFANSSFSDYNAHFVLSYSHSFARDNKENQKCKEERIGASRTHGNVFSMSFHAI